MTTTTTRERRTRCSFQAATSNRTAPKSRSWRLLAAALLLAGLGAPASQALTFDSTSFCDRVGHQIPVDRWALLEYDVSAAGSADLPVRIPYSSDPSYAQDLLQCANLGQGHLPADTAAAYNVFRFSPAVGQEKVEGRRLDFRMPGRLSQLSGVPLDGNLALKIEVNDQGMIRAKDVLFASDRRLGEMVLDQVDEGLQIQDAGETNGGVFVDILYMRFEAGRLVTLAQSHYTEP